MLHIALYSNDSQFLNQVPRQISTHLRGFGQDICRYRKYPLFQTSLYEGGDAPRDLCIVDIRDDPERDMAFVRDLTRDASQQVMVLASGPEYAMAAYDADVMAYLLEPFDGARAASLLLRHFSREFHPQENQFSFKTPGGVQALPGKSILYVEYRNHRMLVHTDQGKTLVTSTTRVPFGETAAQLLQDRRFVRTHSGYLVNLLHVTQVRRSSLLLDTGISIPVSRGRSREVKARFRGLFQGEESA